MNDPVPFVRDPIPFGFDIMMPNGPYGNGNLLPRVLADERFLADVESVSWYHVGGVFIRATWGPVNRTRGYPISQLVAERRRFIYPLFRCGGIHHGIDTMFDGVSDVAKAAIRAGKALLLIDCLFEGHCDIHHNAFERMHYQLAANTLPASMTILVTGNLHSMQFYRLWCEENQPTERMRIIETNDFMYHIARAMVHVDRFVTFQDVLCTPIRRKHFLNLNRIPRTHRTVFVSQVVARGLVDKFFLSHGKTTKSFMPIELVLPHIGIDHLLDDVENMRPHLPFILDQTDFDKNHASTHVKWPYLDSYINVVTETQFYHHEPMTLFISEKTYKPIANMQPFIMIGCTGTLEYLRSLGYETFAPFINEDYDLQPDPQKRMLMILDEVERIAAISLDELQEWYESIVPILAHNRSLLSRTPDLIDPILDELQMFTHAV